MPPSVAEREQLPAGELNIPAHYTTYTSEGSFSISFPSEWARIPSSVIDALQSASMEHLESIDPTSASLSEKAKYLLLTISNHYHKASGINYRGFLYAKLTK